MWCLVVDSRCQCYSAVEQSGCKYRCLTQFLISRKARLLQRLYINLFIMSKSMQQLQNKIKIQSVKILILSRTVLVYFYSVIK